MTVNYVSTDHGILQLTYSDLSGTIGSSAFAGTATNGYSLQLVSGVPTWASVSATNATNLSGGAAGSIPYQTAASTTAFLAAGTNGYVLTLSGGLPTWAASGASGVSSITGTANQVVASASTGAVTLSLPQSIATTSSPSFSAVTSTVATGTAPFTVTSTTPVANLAANTASIPQNSEGGAYTAVLSDANKHIYCTSASANTQTIPANSSVAYPIGTTLTYVAFGAGTVTIAITTDTMYLAGAGTTGSRTLTQYGIATALKITSTSWIISGVNLS
jgi:hypothetical protein